MRIVSPSDCVVLGDVNPGAEIIAEGDVVVFGALRGLAHAGAGGERTARIWALSIEPNQIRIADLVAVPPQGAKPAPTDSRWLRSKTGLSRLSVYENVMVEIEGEGYCTETGFRRNYR